jgi:hypothetical protein
VTGKNALNKEMSIFYMFEIMNLVYQLQRCVKYNDYFSYLRNDVQIIITQKYKILILNYYIDIT